MSQAAGKPLSMDGIMIRRDHSRSTAMPKRAVRRNVTSHHVRDTLTIPASHEPVGVAEAFEPIIARVKEVVLTQPEAISPDEPEAKPTKRAAAEAKETAWWLQGIRYIGQSILVISVLVVCLQLQLSMDSMIGLVYLAMVIFFGIESEWSFGLGLLCLFVVVFDNITKGTQQDVYAIYAFYFLVIGTIRAFIELKFDPAPIAQVAGRSDG